MKKLLATVICLVGCHYAAAQRVITLDQMVDSALHNNIAIRNARHGIEAARQQRLEAFTKYFPNVSGTGAWFDAHRAMAKMRVYPAQFVPQSLAPTLSQMVPAEVLATLARPFDLYMMKHGTIAGITALQPIYAGGQIANGNRLAKVGEDASRLQLQMSENEVEKTAEQYFWQIVSLQEKMKTIDAADTLLADIAKDVEVAVRAGVAMRNDLLQVRLRQNEVESTRLKLVNGLSVVKMLTAQYCGLRDTSFVIGLPTEDGGTTQLSEGNIRMLPEYQLLEKQVEAADLQKKMTVGQNMPTVAVGAGYNYHTLLDDDRTFGMVFATVNIPITDWWGGSHAVKRRKIEQQRAADQLADGSQLLYIRMQKARNDVDEARQQLALAHRGIEQAEENLRLNRDYYRAGTCTMSDLLQAQLLYQQEKDKCTDAEASMHLRLLDYRQAAGL